MGTLSRAFAAMRERMHFWDGGQFSKPRPEGERRTFNVRPAKGGTPAGAWTRQGSRHRFRVHGRRFKSGLVRRIVRREYVRSSNPRTHKL